MYIIFLGAPGAGKGTQAAKLAQELKLVHIASGDLFRQALEQETALGIQVKSYMEKGMLVPDQITIQMVLERLTTSDCESGAILDGFPRNLNQAEALDEALARQAKAIDKVVFIKVGGKELLRRLSGRWVCPNCQAPYHTTDSPPRISGKCDQCDSELQKRSDDAPEAIKKRLEVYFAQTTPLIDYYRQTGKLLEIDGEGSVNEVGRRVASALHSKELAYPRQGRV